MLAIHDDITLTIESLCREWEGVKVWLVLFARYESAHPLDEPFKIFNAHLPASYSIFLHYQPKLYTK